MAEPLLTPNELQDRLGPNVYVDESQALALIEDVSALVRDEADGAFDATTAATCPAALKPVIVSAVRRSLVNPDGFEAEQTDGYSYSGAPTDGPFLTRREVAKVRRLAGLPGASGSLDLGSWMPLPTQPATLPDDGWSETA